MPQGKDRTLTPISTQAKEHLKFVTDAMKQRGLPVSETLLASQAILNIPLPQPEIKSKRRVSKVTAPSRAPVVLA